jgi:hypothetical protein
MQPVINTTFTVDSLLLIALIAGAIIAAIVSAIRTGNRQAIGFLVGMAVLGFGAYSISGMAGRLSLLAIPNNRNPIPQGGVFPNPVPVNLPAPSQILYTNGNAQPIPIQELPGWRKNPPHEGALGAGRAKYVLTSQQFATVEEAEAELFKSLTVDVQESFAKSHSPAVGWTPTPEDLRLSGIIAEQVVETFPLKVGEFENKMHRVSWLIEFDSDKSTVLLKRWEPIEAQRRSKLILSILAGASGVLGVTAMALRRRRNQPTPETAPANSMA